MLFRESGVTSSDREHRGLEALQRRIADNLDDLQKSRANTRERFLKWRAGWQELTGRISARVTGLPKPVLDDSIESVRPMLSLLDQG